MRYLPENLCQEIIVALGNAAEDCEMEGWLETAEELRQLAKKVNDLLSESEVDNE